MVFLVLMTGYEARWGGILFKCNSRPTCVRAGNSGMNMQKRHFMPVPPHFDSGKNSFAARTAFGGLRCKLGIRCVHEFPPFMQLPHSSVDCAMAFEEWLDV